jgi:hypothetical protein
MKTDTKTRIMLGVLGAGWAFSIAGCGASQQSVVATRAMHEFSCPKDQVVVEELGGSSYRAHGCGQTATFTCMGGNVGNPFGAMCTKEGDGKSTH